MLKLTYTEVGLYMEQTMTAPELLLAQYVILAMRLGEHLSIEPSHASFLLPITVPELGQLETVLHQEHSSTVTVCSIDAEFVEISLCGSWVAKNKDAHEGMFLTTMGDRTEALIYKLWQISETPISFLA